MNMPPEIAVWTEALGKQLALFRELASELAASRKACVAMDCDAIYRTTAGQEALCAQLRAISEMCAEALLAVRASLGLPSSLEDPRRVASNLNPAAETHVRSLLAELAQAEGEVRRLNEEQAVLVNGSQRTLRVLGNALAGFSAMYSSPLHSQPFADSRIPK